MFAQILECATPRLLTPIAESVPPCLSAIASGGGASAPGAGGCARA